MAVCCRAVATYDDNAVVVDVVVDVVDDDDDDDCDDNDDETVNVTKPSSVNLNAFASKLVSN